MLSDNEYALIAPKDKPSTADIARASALNAVTVNPEAAAKTYQLSKNLGLPQMAVEDNITLAEQQARFNAIPFAELEKDAPYTLGVLADPEQAKMAWDDYDTLKRLEQAVFPKRTRTSVDALLAVPSRLSNAVSAGYYGQAEGFYGAARTASELLQQETGLGGDAAEYLKTIQQYYKEQRDKGVAGYSKDSGFVEQSIYSGVQSLAQNAPALVAGIFTGNAPLAARALAGFAGLQTAGTSAAEGLDQGLDAEMAALFGTGQGAVEFGTEFIPAAKFFNNLHVGSRLGKMVLEQVASEVPNELAATTLQNLNEWAVLPENAGKPFSDYLEQLPADLAQTAIATLTASTLQVGAGYAANRALRGAVGQAEQEQTSEMDTLENLVQSSKAGARNPEILKNLVAQASEDGKAYIDGAEAVTLYQNLPPEVQKQLAADVPDFVNQLQEAEATNTDIVLSQADYIAHILRRPELNAFKDITRLSLGGKSTAQLKDSAGVESEILDIISKYTQESDGQQGFTEQEAAYNTLYNGLLDANVPSRDAKTIAATFASAYNSLTTRAGGERATQAVADLLDNVTISPAVREELRRMGDSLDQTLSSALRFAKEQQAKAKSKQPTGETGLFDAVAAKKREVATPTPVLSWIESQGGVPSDSPVAGDLRAILDKKASRALKKKGKLRFDAIPANEFNAVFADYGLTAKEDGNGYVDPEWLKDTLREESFGNYARTSEQRAQEAYAQNQEDIARAVYDATGRDILEFKNTAEIRQALQDSGRTFFQSMLPQNLEQLQGLLVTPEYGGVETSIYQQGKTLILGKIVVDKEKRGMGYGKKAMQLIADYADKNNLTIALTPSKDFGASSVNRLKNFYKDFGFVENKGKNKDFTVRETFIRVPQILYQQNRGQVSITDSGAIITAFKGADRSTVLHELSHIYVEAMRRAVAAGDASEQFLADWETLKKFTGATGDAFTVEQEEKIAQGFEAYLFEGKAPSIELEGVFNRIKTWFVNIYESLKNAHLDVGLTNDVRAVFDRMLATQEEIDALARQPKFMVDKTVVEVLTKAEQARYEKLVARQVQSADGKLLRKILKQYEGMASEEYKKNLADVTEEERAILAESPLFNALQFLQKGELLDGSKPFEAVKLDRKAIIDRFGDGILEFLPRGTVTKKGGVEPALLAEMFSLPSGDALINGLKGLKNVQDTLQERVDRTMMERYGDMLHDGTIEREAFEAMYSSSERGEVLAFELQKMGLLAKQPTPSLASIKQAAVNIIEDKRIEQLAPELYYRAETKAAREYGAAAKAQRWGEAADAKRRQILNHYLYKEARAAQRRIENALEGFKKFNKPDKFFARNKYDIDTVEAVRSILSKFGLSRKGGDISARLEELRTENPETYELLSQFIAVTQVQGKPYKQLNIAEFRDLKAAVDNVVHVGKNTRFAYLEGVKADYQQIREELRAGIETLPEKQRKRVTIQTKQQKAVEGLANIGTSQIIMDNFAAQLDGGDYGGAWRKYVLNPIRYAESRYRQARIDAEKQIRAILEPYKEELSGFKEIAVTEFALKGGNANFKNLGEVLGFLQYFGNASNKKKLLEGLEITEGQAQTFINRMIDEGVLQQRHFDLLQSVWDFYESLKPQLQKVHRDLYGFNMPLVEATPLQTPWGEYRGGYVPASIDKNLDQNRRESIAGLTSDVNAMNLSPTTTKGMTQARTNYVAPRVMDLGLMLRHTDDVLRLVHLQKPVLDVAKIFRGDKEFEQALTNRIPNIMESAISPWLERTVNQQISKQGKTENERAVFAALNLVRRRTSAAYIMLNINNAVQNISGLFPAASLVGHRNIARAFTDYIVDRRGVTNAAFEQSEILRNRFNVFEDDDRRAIRNILEQRTIPQKISDWVNEYGYVFQRAIQRIVDVTTWNAGFNRAMQGNVTGVEQGDVEAARRFADSALVRTQGSASPSDISALVGGNALVRIATTFFPYFNVQGQLFLSEMRIAKGMPARKAALVGMVILAPAIVSELIKAAISGDAEDENKDGSVLDDFIMRLGLSPIRYATAMIPFAGNFVSSAALSGFTKSRVDDKVDLTGATVSAAERAGDTITNLVKTGHPSGGDDLSRDVQSMAFLLTMITGVPLNQAAKPVVAVIDAKVDKDSELTIEKPVQAVQGLISGKNPR